MGYCFRHQRKRTHGPSEEKKKRILFSVFLSFFKKGGVKVIWGRRGHDPSERTRGNTKNSSCRKTPNRLWAASDLKTAATKSLAKALSRDHYQRERKGEEKESQGFFFLAAAGSLIIKSGGGIQGEVPEYVNDLD